MKRTLKIIGYIVVIGIILLLGAQWWLGNKIKTTLEEKISEQTQGVLRAEIGSVKVRLIGRSVSLRDITIKNDSSYHTGLKQPLLTADCQIRKISVKGVHFNKKDSVTHLRAKTFFIDAPRLFITKLQSDSLHNVPQKQNSPVRIKIDKTEVQLGNVSYNQYQGNDSVNYTLKGFRCIIDEAKFNPATTLPDSLFSCRDVYAHFATFRNLFDERAQLLQIDSFSLDSRKQIISLDSILLLPQYSKQEFAIKTRKHTDWTEVKVGKTVCYRFNLPQILKNRKLEIDSVEIRNAHIATYKNRQIEQAPRVKRLFYESVQQFPYPLQVRRINLHNINVEYQELAVDGITPGTITFNEIDGTFYDLTNITNERQSYFTLKARGKLMNQGPLQAMFLLPVDSLNQHYEVTGDLGAMPIDALNPMIVPLAKIKVISGEINEMQFKITGNSMKSQINMVFLYDDLKVSILKEKDGHLKKRSFLTTVVNELVLDSSNPQFKRTRTAEGTAERDIYRSQFNYLWKSILSGLKISVGL